MNQTQLSKILPRAPAGAAALLTAAMLRFDITKREDQAAFIATVGHESTQLTVFQEGLNYSAEALLRVFGKYFTASSAAQFARKPAEIANRVYANRGGNGNEVSGDGWRYRGAGAIQLTFLNNHKACAEYFGIPLDKIGAWLRTIDGAILSAGWFWKVNNISRFVGDFDGASDAVNIGRKTSKVGDSNGWPERLRLYNTTLGVL